MSGLGPAHAANRLLARTINLGYAFGGPTEEAWGVELGARHLELCRRAGFSAVRVGIQWAAHTGSAAPYTISPTVLDSVERVVGEAVSRGLAVVLDNHLDPALMRDPPACRQRFLAISDQVARRVTSWPDSVMLEVLNEPHALLDPVWNEYLAEALSVIRSSAPARPLIVGPAFYNSPLRLPELELPEEDEHVIVTIHQYWPIRFTMQGEKWFPGGDAGPRLRTPWAGTASERRELRDGFDAAAAWAEARGRPVFVGEFGSSGNADLASRVLWARYNRELAEQHGFSWGYWSFGPSFALYDFDADDWHGDLLAALIPKVPASRLAAASGWA